MYKKIDKIKWNKRNKTAKYKRNSQKYIQNMEYIQTDENTIESRTKRKSGKNCKLLLLFVAAFVLNLTEVSASHIDFDDVETSWLKDIVIHALPSSVNRNLSSTLVKISGLPLDEIESGVRFQPTFSPTKCDPKEPDLQIVSNSSIDLILSVNKFGAKDDSVYLCVKSAFSTYFQPLGEQSKIKK